MSKKLINDEQLKESINSGLTIWEIGDLFGYKDAQVLYTKIKSLGLKANNNRRQAEERDEQIIKLRRQGFNYIEIADKLNLDNHAVGAIARDKGVGYTEQEKKKFTDIKKGKSVIDSETWAEKVEKKTAGTLEFVEYLGTNEHGDGFIKVRCKEHGTELKISVQAFKPSNMSKPLINKCSECQRVKRKAQTVNYLIGKMNKRQKLKKEIKGQTSIRFCSCGSVLPADIRRLKCSDCLQITKRKQNKAKEIKRRAKLSGGDWSITLEELFKRDVGVCYICGRVCDWNDYVINGDAFIAGDNYPSIEHVFPLSRGGSHTWGNVRLSCRRCNYLKGVSVSPGVA